MTTFHDVAKALNGQVGRLRMAPRASAHVTAPILAAAVHEVFGHSPPLVELAEATQDERARLGYAANDPLVRTHQLQESWVPATGEGISGELAGTGSSLPSAAWQEFGFMNARTGKFVPPRPAGWEGFMAAQPLAKRIWKNTIGRAIKGS